jgi:hypothetical protein
MPTLQEQVISNLGKARLGAQNEYQEAHSGPCYPVSGPLYDQTPSDPDAGPASGRPCSLQP